MHRVMIGSESGYPSWFDVDKATRYSEDRNWDDKNYISVPTGSRWEHETLYRTSGGRWVLMATSDWEGTLPSYQPVDDEAARVWLIANGHDEAAETHFGPIEEERVPGRPTIGGVVNIRLGEQLLQQVDDEANRRGSSRAKTIRDLLTAALTQPQG